MLMRYVTVYADSTGLFSEDECNYDNLCEVCFPEEIVIEWYNENKNACDEDTSRDLRKLISECTYEDWINDVYTADGTDGLYEFALKRGFDCGLGINDHSYVFYRDDDNFKTIVFEGTYDDCRRWCRDAGWEIDGNELEVKEV